MLSDITSNSKEYSNNSIYQYIYDLRKKYDKNLLTEKQQESCINELKIVIPKEDIKNILLKKIKDSAIKNIIFQEDIKKSLAIDWYRWEDEYVWKKCYQENNYFCDYCYH